MICQKKKVKEKYGLAIVEDVKVIRDGNEHHLMEKKCSWPFKFISMFVTLPVEE